MNSTNFFYNKILKYNLINKFLYKKTKYLPKIKSLTLQFNIIDMPMKHFYSYLLSLEWISNQKGKLSCLNTFENNQEKVLVHFNSILQKKILYFFLEKLIFEILPWTKIIMEKTKYISVWKESSYCFAISDVFCFSVLQNEYYFFYKLSELLIKVNLWSKRKKESIFILKNFRVQNYKNKINGREV